MKGNVEITKISYLQYLSVLILLFLFSCGLSDLGGIKHIAFKAHPKIVVPIAYGRIDVNTLFKYVSPGDHNFQPDKDGYYSFEQTITQLSIPDSFAFEGSKYEKLSEAEFRIETYNHFPLGINLELNFIDSLTSETFGDPLECQLLEPAGIDQYGKAISTTHHLETINIPESALSFYTQANAIRLLIHFYLPQSEKNAIFISEEDFLTLNIGMAIQILNSE
jgi:hypothetical protein